jgi:hypothetical protein
MKTLEYLALLNQLKHFKNIGPEKCCFQAKNKHQAIRHSQSYMWRLLLHHAHKIY